MQEFAVGVEVIVGHSCGFFKAQILNFVHQLALHIGRKLFDELLLKDVVDCDGACLVE